MTVQLLFGTSVAFSFVAWAVVAALYIWPQLRSRSRVDALQPLLVLHAFRFIGLSFLVPGVVSPDLPVAFARGAAYGDIVAAILALATLTTLRTSAGIVLAWAFNVWGSFDLLNAFYQANAAGLSAGATPRCLFHPNGGRSAAAHNARIDVSCVTAEPKRAGGGGVERVALWLRAAQLISRQHPAMSEGKADMAH